MIRNLFVIGAEGKSLLAVNFGECHSLGDDKRIISGFISAVHSFSQVISGTGVDEIQLGNLTFMIQQRDGLLFVVTSDKKDRQENQAKLESIVNLFMELYSEVILNLGEKDGDTTFDDFKQILIDRGITDKNCGATPDCTDCENRGKTIPLTKWTELRP